MMEGLFFWVTFHLGQSCKTQPNKMCECVCVCSFCVYERESSECDGGSGPWQVGSPGGFGAPPGSDWGLKQAVFFTRCQLTCCHLVTFKRKQQQSDQSVHSNTSLTTYRQFSVCTVMIVDNQKSQLETWYYGLSLFSNFHWMIYFSFISNKRLSLLNAFLFLLSMKNVIHARPFIKFPVLSIKPLFHPVTKLKNIL